jgi:hypothetical protein
MIFRFLRSLSQITKSPRASRMISDDETALGFFRRSGTSASSAVFQRPVGVDDSPERGGVRRRGFRVERGDVELCEIGRDMTVTTVLIPGPELSPVTWAEIFLGENGPRHEVPPIVGCRRTSKLFLPDGGWHFWSREAHRVGYACQRDDRFGRLQRRAATLNLQLGGKGWATWDRVPQRPKGMRWQTYWKKRECWERAVEGAKEEFVIRG